MAISAQLKLGERDAAASLRSAVAAVTPRPEMVSAIKRET